ncbi:MAG: C40 family peptidase [Clostridia bacterium]|nr:C40 family peptidase [Clostridia bacterium]MBQ9210167.1 C40 family peptidase [Clostridia bacterium]
MLNAEPCENRAPRSVQSTKKKEMQKMIRMYEKQSPITARQVLAIILALILMSAFLPKQPALAEDASIEDAEDWEDGAFVILDDPIYFMGDEDMEVPVITSAGKTNIKVGGVKSRNKLLKYTIPEMLLRLDPNFLSLMVEAEKYIGYPYVYGGSSPETGFDCSGFVCWVFNQSGVFETRRLGAQGLYSLCTDVPREEAIPGDLVFFEKTMGADVKGITHVGIYVGNNMMIHAGDPVGFADLKSAQWAKKIYAYGRLPIE